MVTYQTDGIQEKVTFGSCEIEIGDNPETAMSLGIISSGNIEVKFEETNREFEPANAPKQLIGMATQEATISFTVWDWSLGNVENMRRGLDYVRVIEAGDVEIEAETHIAALGGFFPLKFKNINGMPVSDISVFTESGGLVVADGNYKVAIDPHGGTNIFVLDDAVDITQNQVLKVDYTYSSSAGVEWGTGGLSQMTPRYIRLTNTNDKGEQIIMEFWKATFNGGLSFSFKPDNSTEPNDIPVTFRCVVDATKPKGKQLVQITDMQGKFTGN